MIPWNCIQCGEDMIGFGPIPEDRLCSDCYDAREAAKAFTEDRAGIPKLFQGLTRESWSAHFQRPWPKALRSWSGTPHWIALWGPTGTGKTAIATILLAEHLRTLRHGRWISGPELSKRIQLDFNNAINVIAPLLVTPLLVLDEPLTGAGAGWYLERLLLITRTRDERIACRRSSPVSSSPSFSSNPPPPPRRLSSLAGSPASTSAPAATTSASRRPGDETLPPLPHRARSFSK